MSGFPHTLSHEPSCKNPGLPRQPIFHGDYSFNTGEVRRVSIVDYNIFALTLFVSTVIGFYQGYRSLRNMSPEEYFTAGHHMHAFPVSLSLLASFFSGVTLISTPVEIYNMSTMNFWTGINYFIGIGAAAYIFIPLFYQLKTVSSFEVGGTFPLGFKQRFYKNGKIRQLSIFACTVHLAVRTKNCKQYSCLPLFPRSIVYSAVVSGPTAAACILWEWVWLAKNCARVKMSGES